MGAAGFVQFCCSSWQVSQEPEALNERAVRVIRRVHNKLTGREFGDELTVSQQVEMGSHTNVCRARTPMCA